MSNAAFRHKHVVLDQRKLTRARNVLEAASDTETIDRALDLVCAEAEIDAVLRKLAGKVKLQKVFR